MGNDQSQIKGLQIDQNPIEITDFWTLFSGQLTSGERITFISIFKGEPIVKGQLWAAQSPLSRATKNLMIFRHPSILKYITSWERGSHKFLATEKCKPLIPDLAYQSDVQICLGLRSILCGLIFLLEQANAKHLNVCPAAVYVTPEGSWKLAGFEHLHKSKDVNAGLLERCQPYRYKKGVDLNELKYGPFGIEQYSFAVFCEEVLKNVKEDMPYVTDFKLYCSTHLKHSNAALRPLMSAILLHPFFNHDFVTIHSFLTELPLKSQSEKQQFFTTLIDRLREFTEENVAIQLAGLMLSRMVLLDATAQLCVTPFVLRPKTDQQFPSLFSSEIFTKHIVPKIMSIFSVRDAQIRLILLEYFNYYVHLIPHDDLKDQLLPQLLVGIKDTNDILVAATLRSLADLVPVLGSAIVIGRNRGRLFADGRPHGLPETSNHWIEHRSITPVMNSTELLSNSPTGLDAVDLSESYVSPLNNHSMPERPSPDGGEDIHTSSGVLEFEDETWSDWEAEPTLPTYQTSNSHEDIFNRSEQEIIEDNKSMQTTTIISSVGNEATGTQIEPNSFIKDIKEMDIKPKSSTVDIEDFDFFKDMEPIIQKANVLLIDTGGDDHQIGSNGSGNSDSKSLINQKNIEDKDKFGNTAIVDKSIFEFKTIECESEVAWGDDINEWEND